MVERKIDRHEDESPNSLQIVIANDNFTKGRFVQ